MKNLFPIAVLIVAAIKSATMEQVLKSRRGTRELYPQARILRMDVDTTRRKGAHEQILQNSVQKKQIYY